MINGLGGGGGQLDWPSWVFNRGLIIHKFCRHYKWAIFLFLYECIAITTVASNQMHPLYVWSPAKFPQGTLAHCGCHSSWRWYLAMHFQLSRMEHIGSYRESDVYSCFVDGFKCLVLEEHAGSWFELFSARLPGDHCSEQAPNLRPKRKTYKHESNNDMEVPPLLLSFICLHILTPEIV